ncbi:unnamed protein product [Adineta ricciae]|uniref:Choline/ethanolamine kinase n=1 Tax=Adineta ricciae TaxID=249248 RepID=A0A814CR86_ADIRI|nr:unnamed protein product [Adineta ricciae]CAF0951885.1 unnamed protein product [Adineta ricciae]
MGDIDNTMSPERALNLVTQVFLNEWSLLRMDDVNVTKLSGGYSNTIWLVSRTTCNKNGSSEPHQVIIKVAGGNVMRDSIQRFCSTNDIEEIIITNGASNNGCGPKLYCLSGNSMVVEYIETIKMTPLLALESNMVREIAKSLAKFHSMNLPLDKRGFNVLKKTQEFIEKVPISRTKSHWEDIKDFVKDKIHNLQDVDDFLDWNIVDELEWALLLKDKIKSRIVMSHGDSNFMNYLLRKTEIEGELRVVLCDFEYSCYCERAFDIGGHFSNFVFQWNEDNKLTGHAIPKIDQRREFLIYYLEETKKLSYIHDFDESGRDSIENVMREADYGVVLYYLFILGLMRYSFDAYIKPHSTFANLYKIMINDYNKLKHKFIEMYPKI